MVLENNLRDLMRCIFLELWKFPVNFGRGWTCQEETPRHHGELRKGLVQNVWPFLLLQLTFSVMNHGWHRFINSFQYRQHTVSIRISHHSSWHGSMHLTVSGDSGWQFLIWLTCWRIDGSFVWWSGCLMCLRTDFLWGLILRTKQVRKCVETVFQEERMLILGTHHLIPCIFAIQCAEDEGEREREREIIMCCLSYVFFLPCLFFFL